MKNAKSFTAIQLNSVNENQTVKVTLEYGEITGPYYSQDHPQEEFDTEEEALEWAYNQNKYARWLILPVVRFRD